MSMDFDHQILSKNAFALADASVLDYLPRGVTGVHIVPAGMSANAHLMPVLLDLHGFSSAANSALLTMLYDSHRDNEQPVLVMFLETDLSAAELMRHWNRFQMATPVPSRKSWLRLHDPRVLHQLLRLLNAAQRRRLFGPLNGFTYWVGNAWVTVRKADTAIDHTQGGFGSLQWPWDRIDRIGIVNRAMQAAGVNQSHALHTKGVQAEELIAVATMEFGLSHPADLVEFAMRGLGYSTTFYQHPEITPVIAPRGDADDDSQLADRLALISDAVWSEMSPV